MILINYSFKTKKKKYWHASPLSQYNYKRFQITESKIILTENQFQQTKCPSDQTDSQTLNARIQENSFSEKVKPLNNTQHIAMWNIHKSTVTHSFTIYTFSSNAFSVLFSYFVQYNEHNIFAFCIERKSFSAPNIFRMSVWAGALNFLFHHYYLPNRHNRQVNMFHKQPRFVTLSMLYHSVYFTLNFILVYSSY